MLEYNRIDILEGTHVNKTSASKECDICHYCLFFFSILLLGMNGISVMVVMV